MTDADQSETWLQDVPRPDLSLIHHALRMLAQHPMVDDDEKARIEGLADRFWDESVRRGGG
jgi:hypothetical protein